MSEFDLYLSYSGRKAYKICPLSYNYRYVIKEPVTRDSRSAMFGSVIGKVLEWFYNKKFWMEADPVSFSMSHVEDAINEILTEEKFDRISDPAFVNVLRSDVRTYLPSAIETIRSNGFLTPNSRAEENLSVVYGNEKYGMTLKLGGYADFIHSKDRLDVWILDGKGSQHREKYVDADQLIWYAVQHYIKYHVAPTRLGFVFWKFPNDPIKWIDYDESKMRALLDDTFDVAKKIKLKVFDAKPSGECHRCDYREKCDDGKKYIAHRRVETGGRITDSIFDLETF
jgi:hypothetical protein